MAEDAIKFAIFLVDADQLFDVALGMYDFSLVLMVAQQSQKVNLITIMKRYFYEFCEVYFGNTFLLFRIRENICHF